MHVMMFSLLSVMYRYRFLFGSSLLSVMYRYRFLFGSSSPPGQLMLKKFEVGFVFLRYLEGLLFTAYGLFYLEQALV